MEETQIHSIQVASGFYLDIMNAPCPEHFNLASAGCREGKLKLIFVLDGQLRVDIALRDKRFTRTLGDGTLIVLHNPHTAIVKNDSKAQFVVINLDIGYMKKISGVGEEDRIEDLFNLNECDELPPLVRVQLAGFFSNTKKGPALNLYYHGKAIELLSDLVAHINAVRCVVPAAIDNALSPDDVKRIHTAREILVNNVPSPPSLMELSSMVNLNLDKLKKGFHRLYGKPPYKVLHDYRMEEASALLSKREMNVSEVAWAVGYSSLGHFSSAFQKYYGVKPKAFQLDIVRSA